MRRLSAMWLEARVSRMDGMRLLLRITLRSSILRLCWDRAITRKLIISEFVGLTWGRM